MIDTADSTPTKSQAALDTEVPANKGICSSLSIHR